MRWNEGPWLIVRSTLPGRRLIDSLLGTGRILVEGFSKIAQFLEPFGSFGIRARRGTANEQERQDKGELTAQKEHGSMGYMVPSLRKLSAFQFRSEVN